MILYHGTSSLFKNKIMKHGLQPRNISGKSVYANDQYGSTKLESHPDRIYLTDTYAVEFARLALRTYRGSIMIAAVDVPEDQLLPDTDFPNQPSGVSCLGFSGTCCVKAEAIHPISLYIIQKGVADSIPSDLHTGIKHKAFRTSYVDALEFVLMSHKTRYRRIQGEWEER